MTDTLHLRSASLTRTGLEREVNEDTVYEETNFLDWNHGRPPTPTGLYIVCDGLGGHQAGEVASRLATQTVATELAPIIRGQKLASSDAGWPPYPLIRQLMLAAVSEANKRIWQHGQVNSPDENGRMGTTITLVLVVDNAAYFAHVGHSRAYLWQPGWIRQLTQDHSLAAKMVEEGIISEGEIATHPRSKMLLRAPGQMQTVTIDSFDWQLQPGDRLLLCSDGLWKAFPDPDEMTEWLGAAITPAEVCRCLVSEARFRDGSDDISAVIVFVGEEPRLRHQIFQDEAVPILSEIALPA